MTNPLRAFVERHSILATVPLAGDIALHLAADPHAIFAATERDSRPEAQKFPPYWAFAWPGGQAMARYILDNPAIVAGRRVLDVGSGSGIAAIAAFRAGASSVLAADVDPAAAEAIALNVIANGCGDRITTTTADVLGQAPDADVVLVSDLVYEPELKIRVGAFLAGVRSARVPLLMGDRLTAQHPIAGLEEVARYDASLVPALSDEEVRGARVWRFRPRAVDAGDRRSRIA